LTQRGKHRRSYTEILESILQACPGVRTTLYTRAGIPWAKFHGTDYLPLIIKQGLVREAENHEHLHSVYHGVKVYTLTPKGERYLKLMKEAKDLLGISD
jgi:predicted transcriptional regulator